MQIPMTGGGTRLCRLSHEASNAVWASDSKMQTLLYAIACIVLPVLWGTIVHWIFQHIRSRQNSEHRSADNWPDYQI
jgi:hypothetical protein